MKERHVLKYSVVLDSAGDQYRTHTIHKTHCNTGLPHVRGSKSYSVIQIRTFLCSKLFVDDLQYLPVVSPLNLLPTRHERDTEHPYSSPF